MNRARLFRLWPYAAAIGIVATSFAAFISFERQAGLDLWLWAMGFVAAKWQRVLGPAGLMLIGTMLVMVIEVFFLSWEKTSVFVVLVRRNVSAVIDVASTVFFFSSFKTVVEYFFTFGVAYAIAKLVDAASARFDSVRWELPSEGVLQVTLGFIVFYLLSSFIGYWQHRLMHWRWFWQLHRFHHAATDLNILTTFRVNPAEAFRIVTAVVPLFFIKVPSAGLFAAFVVANQMLALIQHSQLPWNFGWIGRWLIVSPEYHQIHHSMDEEHRDLNYSVCPVWDRMFGTWYSGSNRPSAYGISDQAHVERPLTQWLVDVWIFYRDIARSFAAAMRPTVACVRQRRSPDKLDAPASIPAE